MVLKSIQGPLHLALGSLRACGRCSQRRPVCVAAKNCRPGPRCCCCGDLEASASSLRMVDRETIVISSSDTEEDEPKPKRLAASSSSGGGSSGNSLLASLHEARVARHGEPPPAPAPAPAAAACKAAVPRRHLSIAQRVGDDGRIHWRSNDESIEACLLRPRRRACLLETQPGYR